MALANGSLVRVRNTTPVYLVILGQYCHVPSQQTAQNLFGANWGNLVNTITQGTLNSTLQGVSFTSGACLVQGQGSPAQYLYTWGLKFLIAGPPILTTYNFTTPFLMSPQVVEAMPQGFVIAE
jgi:hypothetical protein